MSVPGPLSPYLGLGNVASLIDEATASVARAHRRPAALRRSDVIVGESVLRGAKLSALLEGTTVEEEPENFIRPYALLSPESSGRTAQAFLRAPLQVFARLDVAAGGNGTPATSDGAARLNALARIITAENVEGMLLAQVVHFEIASRELFGPRSGVVGRVAGRAAAAATGADPLGIAVPETYYYRHKTEYAQALGAWKEANAEGSTSALEFGLRAWGVGGDEADGIAKAA
ncbi:hypothetical protein [Corynebacterium lubricantis]|uniref:hypothetical protein n=1 Tax=Corynebacterium lubricantis TaxID=541095 RepID=UPI00047719AB|nr:hypothetical protein [Corynebacterium lubricantis]